MAWADFQCECVNRMQDEKTKTNPEGGDKSSFSNGPSEAKVPNKAKSKLPQRSRKWSLFDHWNRASYAKQIGWIGKALGGAVAVGVLIIYVLGYQETKRANRAQHMPLVINSKAPEFLQPFICDLPSGLHSGNIQTGAKNIGTAVALRVNPFFGMARVVPEKRTGRAIDEPPNVDCNMKLKPSDMEFPLEPGRETMPQIRQMAMSLPPIKSDDPLQLYWVECVYYMDEYGGEHATCDRFRLSFPTNDNPLDVLSGTPTFFCDSLPRKGKFIPTVGGHCEK
jgi:hypothetical protein